MKRSIIILLSAFLGYSLFATLTVASIVKSPRVSTSPDNLNKAMIKQPPTPPKIDTSIVQVSNAPFQPPYILVVVSVSNNIPSNHFGELQYTTNLSNGPWIDTWLWQDSHGTNTYTFVETNTIIKKYFRVKNY